MTMVPICCTFNVIIFHMWPSGIDVLRCGAHSSSVCVRDLPNHFLSALDYDCKKMAKRTKIIYL